MNNRQTEAAITPKTGNIVNSQKQKENSMKINAKSKAATSPSNIGKPAPQPAIKASLPVTGSRAAKASKNAATGKADTKAGKVKAEPVAIVMGKLQYAVIQGKRGLLGRLYETATQGSMRLIRATQTEKGLTLPENEREWAQVDSNGVVTGSRTARLQCGCYVNGGKYGKGAVVSLFSEGEFLAKAKTGFLKWNIDGNQLTAGMYIGNPATRSCYATRIVLNGQPWVWGIEGDKNHANKHEQGGIFADETGNKIASAVVLK